MLQTFVDSYNYSLHWMLDLDAKGLMNIMQLGDWVASPDKSVRWSLVDDIKYNMRKTWKNMYIIYSSR